MLRAPGGLSATLTALATLALTGCGERAGHNQTRPGSVAEAHEPRTHDDLLAEARKRGPRDCSKDFKFIAANAALGGALEQMKVKDYRRANIRLRDGLEVLGNISLGADVLDDTGLRLSGAWGEDWDGRLQNAAQGRLNILKGRLANYAQLQNLQDCPSPEESARAPLPLPSAE